MISAVEKFVKDPTCFKKTVDIIGHFVPLDCVELSLHKKKHWASLEFNQYKCQMCYSKLSH